MTGSIGMILATSIGTVAAFVPVVAYLVRQQGKDTADRLVAAERHADKAVAEVNHLRDETLQELRSEFRHHCSGDRTQELGTKLEVVIAQNNEILRDLKKLDRESADQNARIGNNTGRLDGLHGQFRKHTDNGRMHGNG